MLPHNLVARATGKTITLTPVTKDRLKTWSKKADKRTQAWVGAAHFDAAAGEMLLLPGASVGKVVGKGGIGLKLMREKHAVTIDLRRDDFGGERLLSLSGSVQAVYNAAAEALEERPEARP